MIAASALTYGLGAVAAAGGGLAMAPIVTLAGLIAAPWRRLPNLARRAGSPLWIAALLVAWFALSLLWSPSPGAPERLMRASLTVLAGALLAAGAATCRIDAHNRWPIWTARLGIGILFLLLAEEALLGMPLNRLGAPHALDWQLASTVSRGVACFALLVWGALLGLARDVRSQVALAFVGAGATAAFGVAFEISAAALAAGLGLLTWLAALAAPRLAALGAGATLAMLVLAAPLLVALADRWADQAPGLPFSWAQRLDIWASAADYIGDAPLIGHGFDASRNFTEAALVNGKDRALIPLHPHNFGLQVWLEGGAVAAVLMASLILTLAWRIARVASRAARQAAAALLTGWSVFASLSFGAWQEWWIAAAAAATALTILAHRGAEGAIDPAPPAR
jgi:O-antigen ligase